MRKLSGIVAAVAMLALAGSASAAEVVIFMTAGGSNATTPQAAQTLGVAPTVPRTVWDANNDGIPDATIPVTVWMAIRQQGTNYSAAGYTAVSGGGFDVAGDNNDVKGTGLNLFRTFNTAAANRRWDSASSANGAVGGPGYLWKGTAFDAGQRSGTADNAATAPKGPDVVSGTNKYWRLADMNLTVNGGGMTSNVGTGDGFFDVFFELANNDFGSGPIDAVPQIQWGWDGAGFLGLRAASGTHRSGTVLRIVTPEPATMCLLGLGGLFLRRRR